MRAGPLGPRACVGQPVFIGPLPNFIFLKKITRIAFIFSLILTHRQSRSHLGVGIGQARLHP